MSVYANGLEVAGKAKKGKSIACFPDPCFTPKSVVPFANTTKASDTANATKTVFIEGKPVMQKDKSYFKTSSGNEAAKGRKGVTTGVKKGKAYFTSWSMNVSVEGYNVCRHSDTMTHNHGSTGNTTVWHYSDGRSGRPPRECFDECVEIEKACGKFNCQGGCANRKAEARCGGKPPANDQERQEQQQEETRQRNKKTLFGRIQRALKNNNIELPLEPNWKMKECMPCAMIKPGGPRTPSEQIDALINQKDQLLESISNFDELFGQGISLNQVSGLLEMIDSSIAEYAFEALLGKKLRFWDLPGDIYDAATGQSPIDIVKNILEEGYANASEAIQTITNLEDFKAQYANASPEDILPMLDYCVNNTASPSHDCLTKRKCMMEPYNKSSGSASVMSKQGCCPGQTAHHIIPNSMIVDDPNNTKISACPGYTHGSAPTICVEGVGHSDGTHGDMHTAMTDELGPTLNNSSRGLDYNRAKAAALEAHRDVFPRANCSRACLEKQMDHYFDDKCTSSNPTLRKTDGYTGRVYEGPSPTMMPVGLPRNN
ncbi:MAG: PAAR-like domain-containing protein [Cellvibrionaceae bacterium]